MWLILAPYVVLVLVYVFGFGVYKAEPPAGTIASAIFKCLPIVYLIMLMLIMPRIDHSQVYYRYGILTGYIFSVVGDFFLNWPKQFFVCGLVCFAFAQLSYTYAFGFSPFGLGTLAVYSLAAALILKVLLPAIKDSSMKVAVTFYVLLLGLMGWRATARHKDKQQLCTWMAMVGAVVFIVSDFAIAFNRWKTKVSRAFLFIMLTYYAAQLLYAVSVLIPVFEAARRIRFMGILGA